ncbi:MAG: 30S ribosomal protein S20 [Acidobacteriota bacterium]
MANHKSAIKRMRQSEIRRQRNRSHQSRMRTAIKKLRAAIAEGHADSARELLGSTLSLVDHTAQKGVIHRNAAARTKSRLTRAVNGLA